MQKGPGGGWGQSPRTIQGKARFPPAGAETAGREPDGQLTPCGKTWGKTVDDLDRGGQGPHRSALLMLPMSFLMKTRLVP